MPNSLTPRETEVLVCLASGKTNRQIAKELHLSLSTVKRHLEHVLPKLKVSDRTQAAVRAGELGLLPDRAGELMPGLPPSARAEEYGSPDQRK
jgi:DNA-binding NarL/FixJ family response regulator